MVAQVSPNFDYECDLLVIGSGAGGMTAAISAAALGADALVIEKSDKYGGTSAMSGGGIWIPNSHLAIAAGQKEAPGDAFTYVRALSDPNVSDEQIEAFVTEAPRMLEWMEEHAGVRYMSVPYTDYHAELPGGKLGWRTHMAVELDGRELGDDLEKLRNPSLAASLFGKISWTLMETQTLLFRHKGWQMALAKMLARYYLDIGQRFRSSKDRFLSLGNALMGMLRLGMRRHDAKLWLETSLVELIEENGRITGALVNREGRSMRVRARRGVVLAAGGFERNAEMRREYLPGSFDPLGSGAQINNQGDSIFAGTKVGASIRNMDSAWWAPVFRVPGEESARLCTFERALPGCIIVNRAGKRYLNEAASYHVTGQKMVAADAEDGVSNPSWIVFDAGYRHRYPMGPVLPLMPDWMLPGEVKQILVRANSIEELAEKTGMPRDALVETIDRFNANARKGEDPDFGRGHNAYDRYYGDQSFTPNPNLAPIEKGPFYAMPIHGGDIGTNGGLVTDAKARVLDTQGQPINGLYAVGNNAASVMGHSYPGAGSTLGPAMTFGWIAGRDAMQANN